MLHICGFGFIQATINFTTVHIHDRRSHELNDASIFAIIFRPFTLFATVACTNLIQII